MTKAKEENIKTPGRPRKSDEQKRIESEKKALLSAKRKGIQKGDRQTKNQRIANNMRLFVNSKYEDMVAAFDQIEDFGQKVRLYLDALNYVLPKMRSIEFQAQDSQTSIEAKLELLINRKIDEDIKDVDHEEL